MSELEHSRFAHDGNLEALNKKLSDQPDFATKKDLVIL
jgi:hypothetical protein